jgi:hypothetical protein
VARREAGVTDAHITPAAILFGETIAAPIHGDAVHAKKTSRGRNIGASLSQTSGSGCRDRNSLTNNHMQALILMRFDSSSS